MNLIAAGAGLAAIAGLFAGVAIKEPYQPGTAAPQILIPRGPDRTGVAEWFPTEGAPPPPYVAPNWLVEADYDALPPLPEIEDMDGPWPRTDADYDGQDSVGPDIEPLRIWTVASQDREQGVVLAQDAGPAGAPSPPDDSAAAPAVQGPPELQDLGGVRQVEAQHDWRSTPAYPSTYSGG